MTLKELQSRIGVVADGVWGPRTDAALRAALTNTNAAKLNDDDIVRAASALGATEAHIRAIKKVESGPAGSFDVKGRATILTEPHVFHDQTNGRFDAVDPAASYRVWRTFPYPKTFDGRWDILMRMARLDHNTAFASCSWGLFQIMGFHAKDLGYASTFDFALAMTSGEAGQLDALVRFIKRRKLDDELRACRPGNSTSCEAFARGYNGAGFRKNSYHTKIAQALL